MLKLMIATLVSCALAACGDASKTSPHPTDSGVTLHDSAVPALDAALDAALAQDGAPPESMRESGIAPLDAAPAVDSTVPLDGRMPPLLPGKVAVDALELGPTTGCIIRAQQVLCWGAVLGASPARMTPTPIAVAGVENPIAVAVGSLHACAVDTQVRCWGSNGRAMYPSGVGSRTEMATNVGGAARTVAAGLNHSCILDTANNVQCWGEITTGLASVKQLDSGDTHVCAIDTQDRVSCWGDDASGQVTGTPSGAVRTARQLSLRGVLAVSAGVGRTCALLSTREVTCWGGPNPFQPVPMLQNTVEVSVGGAISCARSDVGAVVCWDGSYGTTPVSVIVSGATHVSAGSSRACASMSDGRILCWSAGAAPTPLEN